MSEDKWVQRWVVDSESTNGVYIMGKDAEGNYGCTCRGWTMRVKRLCPDCHRLLVLAPSTVKGAKILVCPNCHKAVISPIIERPDCKHIILVKVGGGRSEAQATIDMMKGRL